MYKFTLLIEANAAFSEPKVIRINKPDAETTTTDIQNQNLMLEVSREEEEV